MKKFYVLLMMLSAGSLSFGQTVYSHSATPDIVEGGSAACQGATGTENQGLYNENHFAVAYDLQNDFGVTEDVLVTGVDFAVGSVDANREVIVNVWEASSTVLSIATLNLVATTTVNFTDEAEFTFASAEFAEPYTLSPGTILAVEIVAEDAGEELNQKYFPGTNSAAYTGTGYLLAPDCGITEFTPAIDILPATISPNYIINLVTDNLAVNEAIAAQQVQVYPNPAVDVLNIKTSNSDSIKSVALYNTVGKSVPARLVDGQINVSNLPSGIYTLRMVTDKETITKKVIIK